MALGLVPASRITPGGPSVCVLPVDPAGEADLLRRLADPTASPAAPAVHRLPLASVATGNLAAYAEAAIALAKQARLLPAVAIGLLPAEAGDGAPSPPPRTSWPSASATSRAMRPWRAAASPPVSEAQVPLAGAEATRIITFRPGDGGIEHLAILIGEPAPGRPVLTRLHSACLTGDLLGGCAATAATSSRAPSPRSHARAAACCSIWPRRAAASAWSTSSAPIACRTAAQIRWKPIFSWASTPMSGSICRRRRCCAAWIESVRLMTNNPEKVAGLARLGIAVVERVPHVFPSNRHNEGYLETKATRFGHMF